MRRIVGGVGGLMVVLVLLSASALAANPSGAQYRAQGDDIAWFVAISDTHVGAMDLIYDNKDLDRLDCCGL